jgi:hypothetical protein
MSDFFAIILVDGERNEYDDTYSYQDVISFIERNYAYAKQDSFIPLEMD